MNTRLSDLEQLVSEIKKFRPDCKVAIDYLNKVIGDFPACFGDTPLAIPKGNIPSDKQKCQPKEQHEFTIKGIKIMAASKKDAIKKYNHHKK